MRAAATEGRRSLIPVLEGLVVVGLLALCAAAQESPPLSRGSAPPVPSSAAPPAAPGAVRPGPTVDENDDDDNAARRVRINATAKLALPAGTIQVIYPLLPMDGPDKAALSTLGDGDVLPLTRSMAIKLKTEVEMRFAGGAVARPGNVAAGYAGVYSLWLRRKGDGWSLVLNREPDIWGTMRDAAADSGETVLAHGRDDGAAQPTLEVTLVQSNGGGQLAIAWGADRWVADFEAGPGLAPRAAGSP